MGQTGSNEIDYAGEQKDSFLKHGVAPIAELQMLTTANPIWY